MWYNRVTVKNYIFRRFVMIAIGSDHGGVTLKDVIKEYFDQSGIEYKDYGTQKDVPMDYPDIAEIVANSIVDGECDKGILICGTGIGVSIAANKVKGIRAAHVTDVFSAKMAKEHNDAQIICLGERITGPGHALEIVKAYLSSEHLGGRHQRRVDKIMAIENKQ